MQQSAAQRIIIIMVDGFDLAYWDVIQPPTLNRLARDGFFKRGRCIFPSLTNANNVSIACGCWPATHGVTTNCYFDAAAGKARFLEDASFLCAPTLFSKARWRGMRSALLTCKSKTTKILARDVDLAVAAQAPAPDVCERFGTPPPMYSSEVNYWLFEVGLDILFRRPDIGLLYIHTTDYPMHMWPPEAPESAAHLLRLDAYVEKVVRVAPDAMIILTADHGMNYKTRCYDLDKVCAERDVPVRFAISPVADRLVKHHRGFGGVSYVHTHDQSENELVREAILSLDGVEEVLSREDAAARFRLMPSRLGDLVVLPDEKTVFGDLPEEMEILAPTYRSHGSLYEMSIPLLLHDPNHDNPVADDIVVNLDLTRRLFS
jgi:phosphonoacetate hydrolase